MRDDGEGRAEAPSLRPLGERERFVAFAFAAADLLIEADPDGRIVFAAGAFRLRFGDAPEAFLGLDVAELVAPADRMGFVAGLALLPERGRLSPTVLRLANREQTEFVVSGLHLALPGEAPRLCLSFGPLPLALDARPSLPTPGALLRDAEARLRRGGPPVRLGLIEVSGLLAPDLHAAIAGRVGPAALTAELGPGRFGLLPALGDTGLDLAAITERLESLLAPGGSISGSVLPLDAGALSPVQAVRALRHGLAAFTRGGRERLEGAGFSEGLSGFVHQITQRAGNIRRAIAQRRFHLDYQPIVGLADRRLHHYEALLRPEKGLLGQGEGPQDFVTLAETIGLTEELDLAVAETAVADTAGLGAGQRIAVNVSGLSLQSETFRAEFLALLDGHPQASKRLMVELTESAEIEDEAAAARSIDALRERGIPVCLDDFGAGAAAFRYLKAFRVDFVKVDGAFVQAALRTDRDRSFVAAMVDLSLAVGAKVVAERIETKEAAEMMRSLGVHLGQGWLFGKPGRLPPPEPVAARRRTGAPQESWG